MPIRFAVKSRISMILPALAISAAGGWWALRTAKPSDEQPRDAVPALATASATATPAVVPPHYTVGPATADGIGKFYMGREIARAVGHTSVDWLERSNRDEEEAPSKAIPALALKPTDVVADIGAGSGYYTFRLAPLVPRGKVVAVEIDPEFVALLEKKEKELGLTNVEAHLGALDDARLPPNSIDVVLIVDAYHEFSEPREMLASLFRALKPGGRLIDLEFRGEDPNVPIKPLHKMTEAQVKQELAAVGLAWKVTHTFLPWQHFLAFEKPLR